MWPFAELLDEGRSFSDLVCMLCSALRRGNCQKEFQAYCSLGQGQMKADIASVVSPLTQQPRALQKHARLLITMQKRIVGQRPAVGTHCTMLNTLNTQTSHAQRFKQQICSLWSFIFFQQESPCSDFRLKSCDGKSAAQDIGADSELVDHVDMAECSIL